MVFVIVIFGVKVIIITIEDTGVGLSELSSNSGNFICILRAELLFGVVVILPYLSSDSGGLVIFLSISGFFRRFVFLGEMEYPCIA